MCVSYRGLCISADYVCIVQEKVPLPEDSVYVLLPLNAQKEKHFEDKFANEQPTTFWYKDEKGIVSLLAQTNGMLYAPTFRVTMS